MKRNNTRTYKGMSYRQLQAENSGKLDKGTDKRRKQHGLTNRGWENVIELYEWLISRLGGLRPESPEFAAVMAIANEMRQAILSAEHVFEQHLPPRNVIQFPIQKEQA